jgi:uncharacterized protein
MDVRFFSLAGHSFINICITLLLYGELYEKVSGQETDEIFSNLHYKKQLKTYSLAGHEDYLVKYKQQWINDVYEFIKGSGQ